MATKQKNPYGEFFELLARMPFQSKEMQVYEYSGQTHLPVLYKENYPLYTRMISDMRRLTADPELEVMNKSRKRVIAAIGQWFTLTRKYEDLSYEERMMRIKRTAVIAAGSRGGNFNKLTRAQLERVISEFNSKASTKRRVDIMTLTDDVCDN